MDRSFATKDEIAGLVKAGVQEVLPRAKISEVTVEEDIDSAAGQPTLAIMVVFSKLPTMKGGDYFSLHEAVERRLTAIGETRYPYLRYVGEKELRSAVS